MTVKIGVLAVQGSFREHIKVLKPLVDEVRAVRKASDFVGLDGLIIPGGESTTMGHFLRIKDLAKAMDELPIFGTCAGLIVLSKELIGKKKEGQQLLGKIDAVVERNAYGGQKESFEVDVELSWDDQAFKGIFIRAPRISKYSSDVMVMGRLGDEPVLIRQGRYLASTFHPELTLDTRVHEYFLEEIVKNENR